MSPKSKRTLMTVAHDLLLLSYDDGIPDIAADDMRTLAQELRNLYDKNYQTEHGVHQSAGTGFTVRYRKVKVCPECRTKCAGCHPD